MRREAVQAAVCSLSLLASAGLVSPGNAWATTPVGSCGFDMATLSFRGDDLEQAKCLLRPTLPAGHLSPRLKILPAPLEESIGKPFSVNTAQLTVYLEGLKISPNALGGGLSDPLFHSAAADKPSARYFVIHDVSHNVCDKKADLLKSDDPAASWNLASKWANNPEAHLYITRDGKLVAPQGRTFSVPYPATKLEQQDKSRTRGLFLHVENVQLRMADLKPGESPTYLNKKTKKMECRNDRIAQTPGFTQVQYSRLALVYIAASNRAGHWLIPAYHLAIDDGVGDAHDDPQNFDLNSFAGQLCEHLKGLGRDECAR